MQNGSRTRFWLGWWIGDPPLKDMFPFLYSICNSTTVLVAQVCQADGVPLRFHRSLDQLGLAQWREFYALVVDVGLGSGHDQVVWHLD
jgi:hypothetical protein